MSAALARALWTGDYVFERHLELLELEQVLEQVWQFGPWPDWKTCPNGGYGFTDYES